jgi:branched-chain amino acid transport system substrate-binding protein
VKAATLVQDYAFERDGVAASREAPEVTGADLVHEEYVPTDFTAAAERIFNAKKDEDPERKLSIIWAGGGNPMGKVNAMEPGGYGTGMATGRNILAALAACKGFPGMEGANHYYEIPQSPVNDWLARENLARFDAPPDFFAAGGMAADIAAVEATRIAGSTDSEALVGAMEGMEWLTPKGPMRFRPEDHQALQSMYHFRIKVDPDVEWGIPVLVRDLGIDEMPVPFRN